MRRMSADNHRGQEVKIFHKQAGYMRAMISSHIDDQMSCKRGGSIYVGRSWASCPRGICASVHGRNAGSVRNMNRLTQIRT